ncbi:hypothetical protein YASMINEVIRUS_713 [Yasminevirus sp. GU-2018]|uniref:Uncharacterized protein n=1 Tax=Yasminevirus sp. GU-2018 TaxID=2420051 RepID=A0A5K0U8V7_9VIRU|nr:hypothetical protein YASMINEVIRUS_713 [Yasminevirus sp. GU-2018]
MSCRQCKVNNQNKSLCIDNNQTNCLYPLSRWRSVSLLHPRSSYEWFRLWILIVLIIVLIYCLVTYMNRPLDEYDFKAYITHTKTTQSVEHQTKKLFDDRYLPISEEAEIFDMGKLSSSQLLELPVEYIPNISDFVEDDMM